MVLLLGLVLVACGAPWGGMEGPVGHVNAHTSPLHPQALFRGSGEKPGNAGGSRIKADIVRPQWREGGLDPKGGFRGLQQAEELTVVNSAEALKVAIETGAAHIEIQDHLNLTELSLIESKTNFGDVWKTLLGPVPASVQSIRGNCGGEAPTPTLNATHAPLLPLRPGQCVLLTDEAVLIVLNSKLWLDSLYLRLTERREESRQEAEAWMEYSFSLLQEFIRVEGIEAQVWMTNMTLQGNGDGELDCEECALEVGDAAALYAEDCIFADFDGHRVSSTFLGATSSFVNCTFQDNTIFELDNNQGAAVIFATATPTSYKNNATAEDSGRDTQVRLEGCTFSSDSLPKLVSHDFGIQEAAFFSDPQSASASVCASYTNTRGCKGGALPLEEAGPNFLNSSNPWLEEVEQNLDASLSNTPTQTSSSSGDSGLESPDMLQPDTPGASSPTEAAPSSTSTLSPNSTPAPTSSDQGGGFNPIIWGVGAAVVAVGVAIGAFLLHRRRRRSSSTWQDMHDSKAKALASNAAQESNTSPSPFVTRYEAAEHPQHAALNLSTHPPPLSYTGSYDNLNRDAARHPSAQELPIHTDSTTTTTTTATSTEPLAVVKTPPLVPTVAATGTAQGPPAVDTFDIMSHTAGALLEPPSADAITEDKIDFVHEQLDSIGTDRDVLNGLVLLGSGGHERLQGGQAVVQMARSKHNSLEYAIKFYVSQAAFHAESDMYGSSGAQASSLAQFLPLVRNVESNSTKALVDASGYPLPPCIVMERGESLDIWAARAKPDRALAFAMMHQLALRMKAFHALGYVHRDLKPGNVMWLPRENRWTVIDFGCSARTGEQAGLGFSVAYAAPEVISAYRRGDKSMLAQEALDVWSLGVMAFELLTSQPALRMHTGKDQVMDCIEGLNGQQLPWEGASLTTVNRRRLGIFRNSLITLLARDPMQRPSMAEFCDSCDRVLAGSTTVQV